MLLEALVFRTSNEHIHEILSYSYAHIIQKKKPTTIFLGNLVKKMYYVCIIRENPISSSSHAEWKVATSIKSTAGGHIVKQEQKSLIDEYSGDNQNVS